MEIKNAIQDAKERAEKSYDALRHIQLRMSKHKKNKMYNPLCQTYSPNVV